MDKLAYQLGTLAKAAADAPGAAGTGFNLDWKNPVLRYGLMGGGGGLILWLLRNLLAGKGRGSGLGGMLAHLLIGGGIGAAAGGAFGANSPFKNLLGFNAETPVDPKAPAAPAPAPDHTTNQLNKAKNLIAADDAPPAQPEPQFDHAGYAASPGAARARTDMNDWLTKINPALVPPQPQIPPQQAQQASQALSRSFAPPTVGRPLGELAKRPTTPSAPKPNPAGPYNLPTGTYNAYEALSDFTPPRGPQGWNTTPNVAANNMFKLPVGPKNEFEQAGFGDQEFDYNPAETNAYRKAVDGYYASRN